MPFSVRLEGDFYWASFTGVVTNADLLAMAETAAELEARHEVVPHRLADLGTVDEWKIDSEGVKALARERARRRFPNEFKTAIVAPSALHYGYARMFQTLMGHSQIHVAIFPSTEAALQWLSLPGLELPETPWAPPSNNPSSP